MSDENKEMRQVIEPIDKSNIYRIKRNYYPDDSPTESTGIVGVLSDIANILFDLKIKFKKDDSGIHIKIDKDKNK